MKLYYAIGACSLADKIALAEAGIPCDFERVELHTRITETGADYAALNPKGYVPALVLDSGEMITENIAICPGSPSRRRSFAPRDRWAGSGCWSRWPTSPPRSTRASIPSSSRT